MLNFSDSFLLDKPYPIGLAKNVFAAGLYDTLVDSYPDESLFGYMGQVYHKYSLSERNNPDNYHKFVASSPLWYAFHAYIKSEEFLAAVFGALAKHGQRFPTGTYKSRFEFSSLPGKDGALLPHTDIPSKVITLVIPMTRADNWLAAWGGGTDVLVPKDGTKVYQDYKMTFDDFEVATTFPADPNQALLFIKSEHSWHAVRPCQGPPETFRRTLTVNIEYASR